MKTLGLDSFELDKIGESIHLFGTVWQDTTTKKIYVLPLSEDVQLESDDLSLLVFDDLETLKFINQAWILEGRRNPGTKGHLTKVALVRMQKQVQPQLMWRVFRRDNFTCVYCGDNESAMTFDHYIPESHGGPTTEENGRTCCRGCNSAKGDMTPEEWLESKEHHRRKEWVRKRLERRAKKNANNP